MNRIKIQGLFICVVALMTACKPDDPKPSLEAQQLQKLIGTWTTSSVSVDGTNVNDQYANFSITFFTEGSATKLVATNGAYAFPASGVDSWSFVQRTEGSKMIRSSDNVELTLEVTDKNLTLDFNVVAVSTSGRVNGLEGHFVFVLKKS